MVRANEQLCGAVGRSADQPAAGDRRHRLLPAAGRNAQRVRIDGARPAAAHADPVSAPGARRACRGGRRRADAGRDPRHDPHPRLAQVQRAADQGDRRRQPRALGRRAGDQPQGFRAVDRAHGRHRLPVRRQARRPGGQARQADGRGRRAAKMAAPFNHAVDTWSLEPCQRGRRGAEAKAPAAKSLVDNLKSMLAKPKAKAA